MSGATAISVIVAIKAVAAANEANTKAATATQVARESNTIARQANKLAEQSNTIAEKTAASAREAATDAAWDALLTSAAVLQTFDPATAPDGTAGPLLSEFRTRAMLLVDRLDWDGFGEWLAAEFQFGVLTMQEADERAQKAGRTLSIDQILEFDANFHKWVAAVTQNIRFFRKRGLDADAVAALRNKAREHAETIAARNGWPPPPTSISGLDTLVSDGQSDVTRHDVS